MGEDSKVLIKRIFFHFLKKSTILWIIERLVENRFHQVEIKNQLCSFQPKKHLEKLSENKFFNL